MGLWIHAGLVVATFFGNHFFHIEGYFKYGANLFALFSYLLVLMRNKFLVPFMFLPSILMSKSREHVSFIDSQRARIQRKHPETCTFFPLKTKDNVTLEAMTLIHPDHVGIPMEQTKWLIWINPNGAAFEELLEFLQHYAREIGVSLLAFNYRGVGRSAGMPETAGDLVTDGLAAMNYLLDKGVLSKRILLHGHSMGGGVAAKIRVQFPDGPIIHDRSFTSLTQTILSLISDQPALGALTGSIVGAMVGGVVGGTAACSYPVAISSSLLGLAAVGYAGFKGLFLHAPIIQAAVSALGWSLDVSADWHKIYGHRVVIYHDLDGLIHQKAGLFSALHALSNTGKDMGPKPTKIMKLQFEYAEQQQVITKRHQVYHVYPLDTFKSDWDLIVTEAKLGLQD